MDIEKTILVAAGLSRRVGTRIAEVVRKGEKVKVSHKGRADLVTEIDIWSEEQIRLGVAEAFPEALVIGEETSAALVKERGKSLEELASRGMVWIVDPLDGTSNFTNGIPYCVVSIGVLVDGVRELGVVYDPHRDELFYAIRGKGAYCNDSCLECSTRSDLSDALVASAFPNDRFERWANYKQTFEDLILSTRNVRSFGAAALDLCWLAAGRFDGFFEFNLKPWDLAAASLIVEEAGGRGESFGGSAHGEFSLFGSSFLFASNDLFLPLREVVTRTVR